MNKGVSAVIVAAGLSRRLEGSERKPFLKIGRYSVLEVCVGSFEKNSFIKDIIVVVHKDDIKKAKKLLCGRKKIKSVVSGGRNRSDSVKRGIYELSSEKKIVLIHDAARPLVSSVLISRVIRETGKWGAAVPIVKITSTVKSIKKSFVDKTIDRNNLFMAQTPQGFKTDILKKAIVKKAQSYGKMTDEASLFESLGEKVRIIEGEPANIKITTKEDLEIARKLMKKH
jgi:2-C-methyl-D-erythritol 4-phosphate cytidylyltransferase